MKNKFIKKALSVFTAMAMALLLMTGIPFSELGLGITVSAAEIVANGTCGAEGNESSVTWSLDSDGTLTISGTGAMADYALVLEWPYHYTTPWHDTDNDDQYQNSNIKKVVVEEGITHIGNAAFRDFTELTSISIPNTVKSIGNGSVSYCSKLESLVIPDSVTSIGEEAFDYNRMLTSVTIGNSVESIGAYAFSNVGWSAGTNFTITLPKSVTYIDSRAFSSISRGATIRYSCSYNEGNGYSAENTNATLEQYHLYEYSSSGNKINCSGCTCGEYSSSTATLSLSSDEPIYYTGEEIKPAVTVSYPDDWVGDKTEPNESNCAYSDNINAGTATCTFKYAEGVEASLDFTIEKADLTVTAKNYTIKVGSALPTYEYTVTGLVNNETLPIDVTISCNAADGNTAGTFDIVVSGVAESDNYTFSYVNGTLTVGEKVVVDAPTFTPASGTTFTSSKKVTISCATDGATIYYTTDGSTPTTASTKYTGAITITSTTTIKAIAVKDGMDDSSVVTAKYTKNSSSSGGSGGGSSSSDESPNIEGKNGKKGWSAISDVIEDTKAGEKIVVDMNDATELPKNILEEIEGKDIAIVLNMDNGFIWTINGKDVENPKTIDMGVKKGTRIPAKVINEVTGESEYIEITLSHNGDFGFKAVLTVDMGKNNKGNFANLYYYNGKAMDIICSDEIDENGKADLTFTHASEYVIVIDDTDHTDLSAGESIKVEEIVLL